MLTVISLAHNVDYFLIMHFILGTIVCVRNRELKIGNTNAKPPVERETAV